MADVLIRNMELTDGPITLVLYPNGDVDHLTQDNRYETIAKAIKIPPHGDLIDSKELFFKFNSEMRDIYGSAVNPFCIAVADAPTVLEATE